MQHGIITGNCAYMPYLPPCRDANRCRISMRLNSAVGHYVTVKTRSADKMQSAEGILSEAGSNYIMLYDCSTGTYSVISLDCICAVDIYPPDSMNNGGNDDSNMPDNDYDDDYDNGIDDESPDMPDDDMQEDIEDVFAPFSQSMLDSITPMMYNNNDIGLG